MPITVAIYPGYGGATRGILTRWALTPEERQRIAAGEDFYVMQLNFGDGMTPMQAAVGPLEDWKVK